MADYIARTADFIRESLTGDEAGHDWWHVWRVWQTARQLALAEGANVEIVELGALLHDVADWKFHGGDDQLGPRRAGEWLLSIGTPQSIADHVAQIVAEVTFKGAGVDTTTSSIEAACVQDADRLDALGAIGIARAFAYGGSRGRLLYDPNVPPEMHASFNHYKNSTGPTINHFYEKLLLLRDRMQTATARRLAAERHAFMELYLRQFLAEWSE